MSTLFNIYSLSIDFYINFCLPLFIYLSLCAITLKKSSVSMVMSYKCDGLPRQ